MSEMVEQLDLFSYQEQYTITKPIFLIEAFGGIGAQRKGLEILGVPLSKNHILIEWSKESVKAYARIHNMIDDEKIEEICKGKTKEEMLDRIKGISRDYETPMSDKQLNRLSVEEIKDIYACCIATNNLIDISKVKGRDLGEFSKDEEVIFTYSFPCQSLSLAGLKEGMEKDSGTTSSLLWEIERILREREREQLPNPNVLIMENVPEVVSKPNLKSFLAWCNSLESMGYKSYWKILNGKDYGIPQNRKRVFMVSVLNSEERFTFPHKIKLKYLLNDFLEENVDKKYYLSNEMIKYIAADNELWTGNNDKSIVNKKIASTINTREGSRRCDASNYELVGERERELDLKLILKETTPNKVNVVGNYGNGHHTKDIVDSSGLSATITTGNHNLGQTILIKNATKQGYLEANIGDGIDISTRMESHRGTVQKGSCQTLTTQGGENVGVVVRNGQKTKKVD